MVIWAILTGLVSCGAWFGIVLYQHQRRLSQTHPELIEAMQSRLRELEDVASKLGELEERLVRTERSLERGKRPGRELPPLP